MITAKWESSVVCDQHWHSHFTYRRNRLQAVEDRLASTGETRCALSGSLTVLGASSKLNQNSQYFDRDSKIKGRDSLTWRPHFPMTDLPAHLTNFQAFFSNFLKKWPILWRRPCFLCLWLLRLPSLTALRLTSLPWASKALTIEEVSIFFIVGLFCTKTYHHHRQSQQGHPGRHRWAKAPFCLDRCRHG